MKLEQVTHHVLEKLQGIIKYESNEENTAPRPNSPKPVTYNLSLPSQMLFPPNTFAKTGAQVVEIINQALNETGFTTEESKNVPYVEEGETYARLSLTYADTPPDLRVPLEPQFERKFLGFIKREKSKENILIQTNNLPVIQISFDRIKEKALQIAKAKDLESNDSPKANSHDVKRHAIRALSD